jgi:hypothetical protein
MRANLICILSIGYTLAAGAPLMAQTRAQLVKKADSCFNTKQYQAALPFYRKAIARSEYNTQKQLALYKAAACQAQLNQADSAVHYLKLSIQHGFNDTERLKSDTLFNPVRFNAGWQQAAAFKPQSYSSANPQNAKLITTDVDNFWRAYDLAQQDTANRLAIYKEYYLKPATPGMHDYFTSRVGAFANFSGHLDKEPLYYKAIRENTRMVEKQKPDMIKSFIRLKKLYPKAQFPNVYFVVGRMNSAGTVSDKGLLIGIDQVVRTPDVPLNELTSWEKSATLELNNLPYLIAHELIHFQQRNLAQDTTLLSACIAEGMADFIAELIAGHHANQTVYAFAKGKEAEIWADFKKDMYNRDFGTWLYGGLDEKKNRPADLGYWIGYQICKAYYQNSSNKKQAVFDILHIKNYQEFFKQSKVETTLYAMRTAPKKVLRP